MPRYGGRFDGDATVVAFQDLYWPSPDGLRLQARDYPGGADGRPVLVCLAGLTRNARDYHELARRLSPAWRVLAVNLRGRGGSEAAKDPMTYAPPTYVEDVRALFAQVDLPRVAMIGTSLGGLVAALLSAAGERRRMAGVLLNDIGPEIESAGLARIRGYVGRASVWPTWMHAARCVQDSNRDLFPDYEIEDWLAMAKRLYRLNSAGRIVLDYDLAIAEPFRTAPTGPAPDLRPAFDTLAGVPSLVVRGERSDILSADGARRLAERLPGSELVTVPRVGHAPTLVEPVAFAATERWLARVAQEPARA